MTFIETKGLGWVVVGMAALAACGADEHGSQGGESSAGEGASAASGGVGGRGAAEAGSTSEGDAGASTAEGGASCCRGEHGEDGGSGGTAAAGHGGSGGTAAAGHGGSGGTAAAGHGGSGGTAAAGHGGAAEGVGGSSSGEGTNGGAGAGGEAAQGGAGAAGSAAGGEAGSEAAGGEAQGGGGGEVPPIEREQSGGALRAIATDASHAYIGVGPRVVIHRAARDPYPLALSFVGETAPFGGNVSALAIDGARLFVAEHGPAGGAVHVLDVAEPTRPHLEHSVVVSEGSSRPSALAVDGDTLYVADEERGLFEIDLAAISGPAVVDSVMLDLRPNQLWLEASRLYFAGISSATLSFGALDRDGFTLLGASTQILLEPRRAAFVAPNLLVSHGKWGTSIARVNDGETPLTSRSLPSLAGSGIVIPGRGLAWVTSSDGIHTLELADLEDVAHSNAFPLSSARVVAGAHADRLLTTLAVDGETTLWDVRDPLAPRAFARVALDLPCTNCGAFALHDGLPVVPRADDTRLWLSKLELGGLRSFPTVAAKAGTAYDVAVHGNLIAIADFRFGLRLFGLGDFPRALGSLSRPGAWVVALSGERAFLGGNGLTVVDVADSQAPRLHLELSGSMLVRDLAVDNGLLFVADDTPGQGALHILDTSSPTFEEVGSYSGCERPSSVAVDAELAVVGCGDRFEVIRVSTPEEPASYASWAASAPTLRAVLRDGLAYLADAEGIRVVDVASGRQLAAVAVKGVVHFEVPHSRRIVASLGAGGMRQWQL